MPDEPVQTASVIKMGILLDAAEQIRAGQATLDERLMLTKANQVRGFRRARPTHRAPRTHSWRRAHLMVVLSDNTATNVAIDRSGLAHINETLRAAGLTRRRSTKRSTCRHRAHAARPAEIRPGQNHGARDGLDHGAHRDLPSGSGRCCRRSAGDGPICGAILHMLRSQQDRDSLPRYLETLDTSEPARPSATRPARSTRCATMLPSFLQNTARW